MRKNWTCVGSDIMTGTSEENWSNVSNINTTEHGQKYPLEMFHFIPFLNVQNLWLQEIVADKYFGIFIK